MRARTVALGFLIVAAAFFVLPTADAQVTGNVITFDAVTSYALTPTPTNPNYFQMVVTGVQHGASASSTINFYIGQQTPTVATPVAQTCEKQLLVSINRPGRFSVGFQVANVTTYTVTGCVLTQLP